jgi:hypothetical protein
MTYSKEAEKVLKNMIDEINLINDADLDLDDLD